MKDPSKSVALCEDFFLLIVEAHILAAAMELFCITSLDDTPDSKFFPEGSAEKDSLQRLNVLVPALRRLTKDFVDLNLTFKEQADPKPPSEEDYVHSCACAVLSMGLLLMEFNDAMREGDGSRILQCWKYFLPLFS